jgi:mannose-1-phosphate guanylyltransferase
MIADTIDRARSLVPDERLRILAGAHLTEPFSRALPDLPPSSYLVEPQAKGTCPVLAWAAWEILRQDPDAIMVSLHADHLIRPLEAFQETVRTAARVARDHDLLLTVGAPPDRVETGYGHIEPGARIEDGVEAWAVRTFHEKPDAETAKRYVDAGYVWNTGIFVWKASVFLQEVERHAPEVASRLPLLAEGASAFFDAVPASVVDKAVLERSGRVAVVRASFAWDDVGGWEALARVRPADDAGNVLEGDATVVDGKRNLAYADAGRLVLFGVDDLVAVRAGETTLVTTRARAPDLKALLARLEDDAP